MDVYHQVLHNLNEATGGKGGKAVDFKDLVRKMGFHGNYNDIFERLSGEGWIIETPKADFVSITHWGVSEAKKNAPSAGTSENDELRRQVTKAITGAKELAAVLERFSSKPAKENFPPIEQKLSDLQNLCAQIKNKLN